MMSQSVGYKTILVPTDGSRVADTAVQHAVYLAKALEARIIVLYAVDTHRTISLGVHYQGAVQELSDRGKLALAKAQTEVEENGVEVEVIQLEGHPGRTIVRAANERGADLIVIGATGISGLQELLLGSVSSFVAHNAKCPVLVVRTTSD